jgi:TRAP-type mannitol/chloroaromatic compound transport system permease small subunit
MEKIINIINNITERVGKFASWFAILMVLIISLDVIIRYIFNFTFIWIIELEIYLFGFMFLLGSGYALKHESHVRVDVFYSKMSEKNKAIIDLLGGLLYLMPWCIVVTVGAWKYAYSSFLIGESSAQPGGLPALYILKFAIAIAIGFFLLLLQGVAQILNSLTIIFKKKA